MVFKRFYPEDRYAVDAAGFLPAQPVPSEMDDLALRIVPKHTKQELNDMALKFAEIVPSETYSVAQLQGYLLTKKVNPSGAIEGLPSWLKEQEDEKATLEEMKRKTREDAARRRRDMKDIEEKFRTQERQKSSHAAQERNETGDPVTIEKASNSGVE